MSEKEPDAEERARRFVQAIERGESILVHPDAWRALQEAQPTFAALLERTVGYHGGEVIKSKYADPETFTAFPVKRFDFRPRFNFAEIDESIYVRTLERMYRAPWAIRSVVA